MDFPLKDYMDEDACYRKLVELLHPDGLACPRCGQPQRLGVHNRHRAPLLDYQCGGSAGVFNASIVGHTDQFILKFRKPAH